MTRYSIPGIPLCNASSGSSKSAINSWTQNCRKSPNFEFSEGVPINTNAKGGNYGNCIPRFMTEKNNVFSQRTRLLMNFTADSG